MSTSELLARVLSIDPHTAEMLLTHHNGLRGLAQAAFSDLTTLNQDTAERLLAAMELAKRLTVYTSDERSQVTRAEDAARLVGDMRFLRQEHVRVILLDLNRQVIAIPTVYMGTLNASVLRVSEIFREAITRNIPAMILVHNHPAGDPSPSPEDLELTRSLIAAAKLLDIALIDHIIIGHSGWASIKELGLAF
jgi:DNA repair protein RadC